MPSSRATSWILKYLEIERLVPNLLTSIPDMRDAFRAACEREFFIVKNVPAARSFYRDGLGFEIRFQGPDSDDIIFGVVERGVAISMFKDVGVEPLPNYKRDCNTKSRN